MKVGLQIGYSEKECVRKLTFINQFVHSEKKRDICNEVHFQVSNREFDLQNSFL
jgi:hypothetical protein